MSDPKTNYGVVTEQEMPWDPNNAYTFTSVEESTDKKKSDNKSEE